MYATISADIVSSTSLSEVETVELKQYVEEQFLWSTTKQYKDGES